MLWIIPISPKRNTPTETFEGGAHEQSLRVSALCMLCKYHDRPNLLACCC